MVIRCKIMQRKEMTSAAHVQWQIYDEDHVAAATQHFKPWPSQVRLQNLLHNTLWDAAMTFINPACIYSLCTIQALAIPICGRAQNLRFDERGTDSSAPTPFRSKSASLDDAGKFRYIRFIKSLLFIYLKASFYTHLPATWKFTFAWERYVYGNVLSAAPAVIVS